jgi:hypothetical protein
VSSRGVGVSAATMDAQLTIAMAIVRACCIDADKTAAFGSIKSIIT